MIWQDIIISKKISPKVSEKCLWGNDKELSQKLQTEQDDLTLQKAANTARHWELVKTQNPSTVDAAAWGGKD